MLVLLGIFGVLVETGPDLLPDARGVILFPGVAEAVCRLNQAGHRVAALAERSGPSGSSLNTAMLERIHGQLRDQLRQGGARLDEILSGDQPSSAGTRGGGVIGAALRRYRMAAAETALITDSLLDLKQAAALGCRRILVRTGRGARTQAEGLPAEVLPVQVHESVPAAVEALLGSGA